MMNVKDLSYDDIVGAINEHGSERKAAVALGVPRTSLQDWFRKLKAARFTSRRQKDPVRLSAEDDVRYFIFTSAQDGTSIHKEFWDNLIAYANDLGAEIFVSGFTYNKTLFEDHSKYKATYAEEIREHLADYRIEIGERLMFCGEMNTLPTAVMPLSGFETYTGRKSGIFPHPKVHLQSVPVMKNAPTKIIMTTGAVTLPNYVPKKAGIKAEFHHIIGAVLVELLPDGNYFARHLLADEDGTFYDLDRRVAGGFVSNGHRVEAINWGDIHHEKMDPTIARASWGSFEGEPTRAGVVDALMPHYQFIHDATDFRARNHHNIKDPHHLYEMWASGTDSISADMDNLAQFLKDIARPWCQTVVVESNHDRALMKWLKTADYRLDPANAPFFLRCQLKVYEEIKHGLGNFNLLQWVLSEYQDLDDVIFLNEDQSFVICDGIECGMHGHLGANGAKASPRQFTKMGPRANTGHTHSASIIDGIYTAGVTAKLDMGYNKGLSSWSHSHIVTYRNGKRVIITMLPDGRWRA